MPGKTKIIVAVVFSASFLFVPARALWQQQETDLVESMPEGQGKELVRTLCTAGCHSLETTLTQGKSREEWQETVMNMVSRGAQIFTEETDAIISYLAEHYGVETAVSGSTDSPGEELFKEKCFECHGEGIWRDLREDRKGWEGVLFRMVGRGALWTEEEITSMAEYLVQAYGPGRAR